MCRLAVLGRSSVAADQRDARATRGRFCTQCPSRPERRHSCAKRQNCKVGASAPQMHVEADRVGKTQTPQGGDHTLVSPPIRRPCAKHIAVRFTRRRNLHQILVACHGHCPGRRETGFRPWHNKRTSDQLPLLRRWGLTNGKIERVLRAGSTSRTSWIFTKTLALECSST